jgi:pyridoxal phosphate enzyme (YggS family)
MSAPDSIPPGLNPSDPSAARLAENLARIRERIASAAARSGRPPEAVQLVGVTKYATAEVTRALATAGLIDLGESRPQSLWDKAAALADLSIRWHLVGHLQRNKVRRTLPIVSLVHSIDSLRLLGAIDEERALVAESGGSTRGQPVAALLEVNISGDAAKHGFQPAELEPLLAELPKFAHVRIRGLMAMASLDGGADRARRDFAALRELRDRLQTLAPAEVSLAELSMGMSDDYEVAIEEGATIVRVGSALFEGVIEG